MVVPKVGQDPVCYNEVIAVQRSEEARPVQKDEKSPTRTTRKKTTASSETGAVDEAAPVKPRRVATKKATAAVDGQGEKTGTTAPAARRAATKKIAADGEGEKTGTTAPAARRATAKRAVANTKNTAKTPARRTGNATGAVAAPKRGTKAAK